MTNHRARGTKLELPLWMVEGLAANPSKDYISVDVPKTFKVSINNPRVLYDPLTNYRRSSERSCPQIRWW